ncbi:GNAT family N-acetyltransferase [Pontibacillus salicampi]|uniref:GNAT family N-acetyltransferase n=1 Tax=Pontibacillus salicampi TaxID=1449801 RepID=A0ABV6LK70_9BACI
MVIIPSMTFNHKSLSYTIRSAVPDDARQMSKIRNRIDMETNYLDREPGEAFLDEIGFRKLIEQDTIKEKNLCLVAEVENRLVGFSRCEGTELKRLHHNIEFGVGVLRDYWGFGIGKHLLLQSIAWADNNNILKINLRVLETNIKAIHLYRRYGFNIEGLLKFDKRLSDGKFYNTIIMGRWKDDVS